jgi:pyruvate formate lyase activating enzyme
MTVEEVIKEVLIDLPFFEASQGGMTLSGGEPMLQFGFTRALLKAAKKKGLHTCLETCGQAPWQQFQAILADVNIFLYDFKTAFPGEHTHLTGHTNTRILANLDRLYHTGAKIILRCPLIPGLNDSQKHLDQIIQLCRQYPHLLGIEIMPYHELGRSKSKQIGRQVPLGQIPTPDENQKNKWKAYLDARDCNNIRMA